MMNVSCVEPRWLGLGLGRSCVVLAELVHHSLLTEVPHVAPNGGTPAMDAHEYQE